MKNKLYISHFFNTWDERMYEFASCLLIITKFSDTMLPYSIFGLTIATSGILFNGYIGKLIDQCSRLNLVISTILVQKIMILMCCVMLFVMNSYIDLFILTIMSCIAKLASVANTIAVEKDWVLCIYGKDKEQLSKVNSVIRRIDLISKMLAPIFISFIIDSNYGLIFIIIFNITGLIIEIIYTRQIFNVTIFEDRNQNIPDIKLRSWYVTWKIYITDNSFYASIPCAFLYLTVLSFAGSMVSYLKWVGYSDTTIAVIRSLTIVMGIIATHIQPWYTSKVGTTRSALHFIWFEVIMMIFVIISFYTPISTYSMLMLVIGFSLSRIGLWGFDLSQTQIMQENVDSSKIGTIYGCQYTLCSVFELLQYVLTIIWSSPKDFYIPASISCTMVLLSAIVFTKYYYNIKKLDTKYSIIS
jgi:solute carrier family 40 (iron-regulated transporter), member 1